MDTSETMHILSANYGRLSLDKCEPTPPLDYPDNITDCRADNSTKILQDKCDGLVFCRIFATDSEFGYDPCINVPKYLEVTYECIQSGRYHI